jgi:hypothetical protein
MVLKCYKDVFKIEHITNGIGGFIIVSIMVIEFAFTIVFFLYDMPLIRNYLYHLTQYFLIYSNGINKNIFNNNRLMTGSLNAKEPPKRKDYKKKKKFRTIKYSKKKLSNDENISKSLNTCKSSALISVNKKANINMSRHLLKNKNEVNIDDKKAFRELMKAKESCGNIDIQEYLKNDLDEMEYDDAIKFDKRTFCAFFTERIKSKQILINTFCNKERLIPMSIKIILFALNIDLYFVVNGLFFSEEYLAEVFELDEEESFFSFFPRSIDRFFYTSIVGTVIGMIIDCIFIEEKKIKRIFLREKDDQMQLKYEISIVARSIKNRFTIFVFLCFFIAIISWYYISCFNNTYPCIKMEWIKSSVTLIIIMNILPIFIVMLEAIIRSLSFYYKSEKLYKFKKLIS